MFTHVRHTLVGNNITSASEINDAVAGDILVVDDKNNIVKAAGDLDNANWIKIGVVKNIMQIADPNTPGSLMNVPNIEWGREIQKGVKGIATSGTHEAPTEETAVIDLANVTIPAGQLKDYALRILYKDMDTVKSQQYTYTYRIYDVTSNTDMVTKFVDAVNRDPRSRVIATASGTTITLTGMVIPIENNIDEYRQVKFDVSLSEIPRDIALINLNRQPVAGATITVTQANPGAGNPQQVIDAQRRFRGYKGQIYLGAYPSVEGNVVMATENYNWMTINFNNLYRSNDNQYIKDTPIGYEVYAQTANLNTIATLVNTFLA